MKSNFEFLNKYWEDLAEIGKTAETYLYSDSNACIYKLGLLSESMLLKILDYENIARPTDTSQLTIINLLRREGLLPSNIDDFLYTIRKTRNKAAHANYNSQQDAEKLLKITWHLCNWFMEVYGDWEYVPAPFQLPEKIDDLAYLKELLEKQEARIDSIVAGMEYVSTNASEMTTEERSKVSSEAASSISLDHEEMDFLNEEQVRVEIAAVQAINYAMQQNNVKIVESIEIKNNLNRPIEHVKLLIKSNPSFLIPFEMIIDQISEGENKKIRNLAVKMDIDYLMSLTESQTGSLTVSVLEEEDTVAEETVDIELLSYDQWCGISFNPSIICAYVTPNHPAIAGILSSAAELLKEWTRNPSFDGYQSYDKNRVRFQVAAIYGAVRKLNINYCESPANYHMVGQRLRLCETVLSQKQANCIDMTLLFASCLEAIKIHPIIVFEKSHAYIGYWLSDQHLPDVVVDDPSVITKRMGGGINDIRVFETTAAMYGIATDFSNAENYAYAEIMSSNNEFEYIVDVVCARLNNVKPIAGRITKETGISHVERDDENLVIEAPLILDELNETEYDVVKPEETFNKKEQWERKLLDLGLRNPLINMHLNRSIVPMLTPSVEQLEDRLADGESFMLFPKTDEWINSDTKDDFEQFSVLKKHKTFLQSEFENKRLRTALNDTDLQKTLVKLFRSARSSLEENGANTLYLAIGLLKWCEARKVTNPHYAPIILLPVDIKKKTSARNYQLTLRDEEPQLNITILEKLKQDFGITISGLESLPEDEHGYNIRKILKIFTEGVINQPYWDVLDSAYLGIFSFSQFVMWNDIHTKSDELEKNKIVNSLLEGKLTWDARSMNTDEVKDDYSDVYLPLPVDGSQLFAIQEANRGSSFVLHGPPGTGKSQTITALIANALGHGRKVLFVAEKRAALEVVQDRLTKIGLEPFCLELHSNKAKKTVVLEHLKRVAETRKLRTSNYRTKITELENVKDDLDKYAFALHEQGPNKLSLFDAINNYEEYSYAPGIADLYFFEPEKIEDFQRAHKYTIIEDLISAGTKIGHPKNHPLSPVAETQFSPIYKKNLKIAAEEYLESIHDYDSFLNEMADTLHTDRESSCELYENADELKAKFEILETIPTAWTKQADLNLYFTELKRLVKREKSGTRIISEIETEWDKKILLRDLSDLYEQSASADDEPFDYAVEEYLKIFSAVKPYAKYDFIPASDILEQAGLKPEDEDYSNAYHYLEETAEVNNRLTEDDFRQFCRIRLDNYDKNTLRTVIKSSKEYSNKLTKCREAVANFASVILKDRKASYADVFRLAEMLKEWEGMPRAFAMSEQPAIYFQKISTMAESFLKAEEDKKELLERWNSTVLTLDSEDLMNQYKEISASGFLSRMSNMGKLGKYLNTFAKEPVDKKDIGKELALLSSYQTSLREAESILDEHGADMEYLYQGNNTEWEKIRAIAEDYLKKSQELDDLFSTNEIRRNYAANPEVSILIDHVIETHEDVKQCREDFYPMLDIEPGASENINSDIALCNNLTENKNGFANWISFMKCCSLASDYNLEDLINSRLENRIPKIITINSIRMLLNRTKSFHGTVDRNSESYISYVKELGDIYKGLDTDWDNVLNRMNTSYASLKEIDKNPEYRNIRLNSVYNGSYRELAELLESRNRNFSQKRNSFYDLMKKSVTPLDSNWVERETALCNDILMNIESLRDWVVFNKVAQDAIDAELGPVVRAYRNGMSEKDLLPAYKKEYFEQLAEVLISEHPMLNNFSNVMFEEKIKRFKEKDEELYKLNQRIIFNKLVDNIPDFTSEASRNSEINFLQRAIRSRGRGLSLRRIFEKVPNILTKLCPCMLMSPISVAQYLNTDQTLFDLVVFDEASQLRTCKAVGAIARAENAIIVGDPNQMPPTNFFMTDIFDEDNVEMEDMESILDDCLALNMPQTHLLWHYRSKHESLIAFSNHQFYENKLFTFPSSDERESKVSYKYVKGVFARGRKRTNEIEARAVVDELIRRSKDPIMKTYSYGIVTFNNTQQVLIEDLIMEARESNMIFDRWVGSRDDEPLIVKNLENIQGDERDIILFSVCYGPDERGKVSMNFGPLNREGGWRRLNVAVSRARREMVVFSSLIPEQIDLTKTSSKGVEELHNFLDYASRNHLETSSASAIEESELNEGIVNAICHELNEKGYQTEKNIGHSKYRIEIGVVDPNVKGRYILGIILDGSNYMLANTTHDREVSQTDILRGLGWSIYRVWTMEWWNHKEWYIKDIVKTLEKKLSVYEMKMFMKNTDVGQIEETPEKKIDPPVDMGVIEKKPIVVETPAEPAVEQKEEAETVHTVIPVSVPKLEQKTITKTEISEKPKKRKAVIKDDKRDFDEVLSEEFEVIDNRKQSGIFWVIYQADKKELFKEIAEKYKMDYSLEKRGAMATNGRKAYRIMCRKG